MSFLRRTVFAPLIFSLVLSGAIACGLSIFALEFTDIKLSYIQYGAFGMMLILSIISFYFIVISPLGKIMREMKALLTGKTYRRIVTSKTNEIGILAHFFNEVTRNLESISGSVQTNKRIQKELNSAQEIQQLLIPKNAPEILGLEVTAKTRPASEIGGDIFNFFPKEKNTLVYIGDSTGHGIPAGIVMVMVDALLETFIHLENDLIEIIVKVNQFLKPHLKPSMFMTMVLLEWIPDESKIKWIGAGHEHILHVHTGEAKVEAIRAGGIAIGMLADNRKLVSEKEMLLKENDFLVLYSDGITEAKNLQGELYGLVRFQNFLQDHASAATSTDELFEKIAIDVGRFMSGQTQLDDMTLIVLKHTSTNAPKKEADTQWKAPN